MFRATSLSLSKHNRNPIDQFGSIVAFSPRQKIFRKGEVARHIYKVESGCVRAYIYQGDRRFISGFYFPGDYFGLEMSKVHSASAEAVVASRVLAIKQRALTTASKSDGSVAKFMLDITNIAMHRAQDHSVMLRNTAKERVANFLFDMKKRDRQKEVKLLMTRQDIADYLNLSIESVSRTLTELEDDRAISFLAQRRIAVHIRKRLAA